MFGKIKKLLLKQKKHSKQIEFFSIISLVLVAAFLRIYKIRGYMTFLGDEGRDVLIVKRMIVDHDITFLGPNASVGGFFLGPIYYYFMAPFLALSRLDPVGPAVMVALFGVATVYLLYRFGRELYNPFVGCIAATLYALSPLVIAQSRSSWNPNLVPFFSLLMMHGLWKAVKTENKWWFFTIGACIGIGVQLHYLFLFLIPVALIYLFIYCRPIVKKIINYLWVAAGFIVPLIPFIGFEIKNNFPNTRTISKFLVSSDELSYKLSGFEIIQDVVYRLFSRLVFYFPPPEQIYANPKAIYGPWNGVIVATIIFSIGFVIYRTYKQRKMQDVLLLLWLVFGVGLFSLYRKSIYDYYMVIMFTLPFILTAQLIDQMIKKKYLAIVGIGMFVWLVWLNLTGVPFKSGPNNQLDQVKAISEQAFEKADGKPFNFALITGHNSDHGYRYFFEIWGNPPVVIQNPDIDPARTTVTDQLIVICEISPCEPLGHPLWEVAGFGRAEIVDREEFSYVQIYKLVHLKEPMVQ